MFGIIYHDVFCCNSVHFQVTIHVKPPPHTVDAELAPIECVRSCKRRFRLSDCSEPQFDVGPRIDPRGQVYSVRHKHGILLACPVLISMQL
jgi:hypothetical protein